MGQSEKKNGKHRRKNDLPVLDSDTDFLSAFQEEEKKGDRKVEKNTGDAAQGNNGINKHGLPFIEDYESRFTTDRSDAASDAPDESTEPLQEDLSDEEFARLLDASFKTAPPNRHTPKPMPLKRRLKRYPAPEADLDLHGFTAIGAEVKARSFITGAKQQGFFTVRIVVGRGLHSEEGPVLPHVVEDLLKTLKKENIVLSYNWEGRKKGRSGALIVYLKQFND